MLQQEKESFIAALRRTGLLLMIKDDVIYQKYIMKLVKNVALDPASADRSLRPLIVTPLRPLFLPPVLTSQSG